MRNYNHINDKELHIFQLIHKIQSYNWHLGNLNITQNVVKTDS